MSLNILQKEIEISSTGTPAYCHRYIFWYFCSSGKHNIQWNFKICFEEPTL